VVLVFRLQGILTEELTMTRKLIIHLGFCLLIAALLVALFGVALADTGNIDTTNKWAWGTNIGWINFRPTHGGATVYSDHLEGYIWAENIGWIRLGSHEGGGAHTYANDAAETYGVNNDGSGNLSGYAWSTSTGWINFNPSHSQVTINTSTGEFDGYAWGENIGWIHFRNPTGGPSQAYSVVTDFYPTAVTLASFTATPLAESILLHWETASEIDTLGFHLYRAEAPEGQRTRLNGALIPGQAPGGPVGAVYEFVDETAVAGTTYHYWLEDVDLHGTTTLHGPVSAGLGPLRRLLPVRPRLAPLSPFWGSR
jgi:hypothetical protein